MRPRPQSRRSLALSCGLSAAALAAAGNSPLANGEEIDKGVAKQCLYQNEMRTTKVVDDRTILFTTRDGRTYSNNLPRQCPSMRRGSLLNYTFESRRLCAGSMFQVLWDLGGRRMPTFTCPLGIFSPITDDEAQDLIASARSRESGRGSGRGERDRVKIEPADIATPPPPAPPPIE